MSIGIPRLANIITLYCDWLRSLKQEKGYFFSCTEGKGVVKTFNEVHKMPRYLLFYYEISFLSSFNQHEIQKKHSNILGGLLKCFQYYNSDMNFFLLLFIKLSLSQYFSPFLAPIGDGNVTFTLRYWISVWKKSINYR